jgi:hypothetical protein
MPPVTWDGEPLPPPNLQKPARGSLILAREKAEAEADRIEREEKGKAKKRDGRCRWPEKHICRGGALEAAHIEDASLGGPMDAKNLITVCQWIHRRGPESIHGKQLKVEPRQSAAHGARCPSGDRPASSMRSDSPPTTWSHARRGPFNTSGTDEIRRVRLHQRADDSERRLHHRGERRRRRPRRISTCSSAVCRAFCPHLSPAPSRPRGRTCRTRKRGSRTTSPSSTAARMC